MIGCTCAEANRARREISNEDVETANAQVLQALTRITEDERIYAAALCLSPDAAPLSAGTPGVLHGFRSYLMQDANGQIIETHSVSAGLDYPGVGPEHSWLKDAGRAEYVAIDDDEAMAAFHDLCKYEGIIPALESSHAVAQAKKLAPTLGKDKIILVNLSGRGDKDINTVAKVAGITL